MNQAPDIKYVKFRFPKQAMVALDELKRELGASNRVDVIKQGLAILHWAVEQRSKGAYYLGFMDKNGALMDKTLLPGI